MRRSIGAIAIAMLMGALAGSCLVWSVNEAPSAADGTAADEWTPLDDAGDDPAQAEVRKVLAKINEAWRVEEGAPLMREALAEHYVSLLPKPGAPGEYRSVDRDRLVELFTEALKVSRPQKHEHRPSVMKTFGNVVYEIGVSEHVGANGMQRKSDVFNVFVEEDGVWQLIFSADARDVRDTIRLREKLSKASAKPEAE